MNPQAAGLAWMERAVCAEHQNPGLWFPPNDDYTSPAAAEAVSVCQGCPVQRECTDHALTGEGIPHGIFGGLTPQERMELMPASASAARVGSASVFEGWDPAVCAKYPTDPQIPGRAHYKAHRVRNQEGCPTSKAQTNALRQQQREQQSDGRGRPDPISAPSDEVVCGRYPEDPTHPSTAHAQEHRRRGEQTCSTAKAQAAEYYRRYHNRERRLDRPERICDRYPTDPDHPSKAHYRAHLRRGEPPCKVSLKQSSSATLQVYYRKKKDKQKEEE